MTDSSTHPVATIETKHTDVVHDTQFDYYGQWLATASSDGTVKVFSAKDQSHVATLTGHEGPVWIIAWAHPRFGSVLASASYDRRVIVWKECNEGASGRQWRPVHLISAHTGSVNSVAWAPQEYGALLASASSDGFVAVTSCVAGSWRETVKLAINGDVAHSLGATSVSFAPFHPSVSDVILASGGCDGKIRLWRGSTDSAFSSIATLAHHSDWVRDVAFSPDGSSPFVTLASCGQDNKVVVARKLREVFAEESGWEVSVTPFTESVWRLSWSPCGTMLLVTTGESDVFTLTEGKLFTDSWTRAPLKV